jgi:hypothetical protein
MKSTRSGQASQINDLMFTIFKWNVMFRSITVVRGSSLRVTKERLTLVSTLDFGPNAFSEAGVGTAAETCQKTKVVCMVSCTFGAFTLRGEICFLRPIYVSYRLFYRLSYLWQESLLFCGVIQGGHFLQKVYVFS